ncbi:MAG TPA: SIMPL domain-containing protein [Candidatus Paceibacterota bacterium]
MNQIPKNFWSSLNGLIAVLIALVAVGIIIGIKMIGHVGENPNNFSTINVDGTGYVVAVPDVATFSFSVTQTAKTVADAQAKATAQINSALKAVRDQGIADKDITTQSYTINPHYEYQNAVCPAVSSTVSYCPGGKSVLTGYDVSQTISVKVRDLTKAGTIFTSIGNLGVQNVNGLDFAVDEPKTVQAQAREKAINDAKEKAAILAKQLGVSIVRVISFSENSSGGYPRPMMYAKDMVMNEAAASIAPEVPTGEQKVTSNVTVTYEIE